MIGFYVFLGIKLGPEYMNFMSVRSAVQGVADEAGIEKIGRQEMRTRIAKRLNVSSIYFIQKEDITVKEMEDGLHVIADYHREIPLFSNVYVLLKFKHDASVKNGN